MMEQFITSAKAAGITGGERDVFTVRQYLCTEVGFYQASAVAKRVVPAVRSDVWRAESSFPTTGSTR